MSACTEERRETPTKGQTTVVVAESVSPVIQQEKLKFEELYPQAKVGLQVASDREAIARLFNDSISIIVSSRPLNKEEREVAKRFKLALGEFKVAIDGIAIIVNNENPMTQLRTTQLDSILSGSAKEWKSAGWKQSTSSVALCLPDRNTGTFEVIAEKILQGKQFTNPAKIVSSSAEIIEFVSQHENALGMVGVNWFVDNKNKVKALELTDPNAPDSLGIKGKYYGPYQAYIYQKFYPLTKDVYIYSRADNYGVAAGFTSFMTSSAGQKIILNSGLVPATMPVRLVEITNRSIQ
jgi:phosphate transport system substrate-binding protein